MASWDYWEDDQRDEQLRADRWEIADEMERLEQRLTDRLRDHGGLGEGRHEPKKQEREAA